MTKPEVGYLLPTRDQSVLGDHDLARLAVRARRAEELGLDSVWAGDSPLTRPRADPLLLLAAVSQATERVALGTAVLLPALRHPILLAHQLATLDRLSDGRLIAGMGSGFPNPATRAQFASIGIGFERRTSRTEESITVMRQLWSGETVSFQGEHFAFEDVRIAPPPSRPGGPPVWLPGNGVPALRRVARLADGWLPYPATAAMYAEGHQVIERAAAPRSVTPALYVTLCLTQDPEKARRRLRTSVERYYGVPLDVIARIQALFAGTARQAADWLTGYVAAGARHLVIRLAADDHEAALEEFADRVLPLLREEDHR
ncbi:probable F420-dependent oxidoreductase, Rv2161c family [Streptomyces sp. 1222.5]|uniref:LLM class flavin-dependent oxidoreductase n=1 Tax=unclassified Streptomyces TaxID=2593676 RepID=UPI00089B4442|nr:MULTISPECIES: LLM class flavin-dependent oxidoreductase [unclassified Streptomyces]PKW09706.1 putative F420-dependent oxidoreductase [Streptomyces sp. 5112.2]SEC27240.1 probable F420-dependent oxidoreductase, Rv2161c family [Streptomyces sp. 1222.5]